jgi:hypothetical protein
VIIASVPYVLESGELKQEQIENQAAGAARRGQPNSQKSESTLRDEFEQNK